MLVFTVLVSLPNKTCSKQMTTIMSDKRSRHKKLQNWNTSWEEPTPKRQIVLGECGSKQQKIIDTNKDGNISVRNKKQIPNHHNSTEHNQSKVDPHTYEKFKPIWVLNGISKLLNLFRIQLKCTNEALLLISYTKSSIYTIRHTERVYLEEKDIIDVVLNSKQRQGWSDNNNSILKNFISSWLSISSFPPRTSPRPPHLCMGFSDGWQNGRL